MRHAIIATTMSAIAIWCGAQPPVLPQKGAGPGKPLSPQEAQKLFHIDDGLRIELVACEPQVESPVAMAFDPDGRLWVVEMRDYPNGPGKGKPPMGRIRILEDKDGDGFFETATTWADNLLFANGLLLWKDGAIVTMAPHIAHLRDTTGAGKADKKDVLYEGFIAQNPQLRVSHPILGLDGWIYCANGLRGGKVIKHSPLPPGGEGPGVRGSADLKPVDLSGMDFRFDPVSGLYEAITGMGQFGNTFDEWGNRFVCDNRHHLRHIVMENRYIKRNPYLAAPALVQDVSVLDDGPLSSGGKVYPLSKNWTTSSLHEGRFTAACGVFIYHGNLLDPSRKRERRNGDEPVAHASGSYYHGAAFTCEPTGNLVHMEVMKPKGATFESRPAKDKVEFLATTDDWFRPVFLTHGPEGAMYVADMYRAVIEHPDFMPPELKQRPDLWQGKDKGRIWRIVPKDHVTKTPRPNLSKASIADLVKRLEHPEPWWRTTAQRLLLEKNDKAMIEPLTKLLDTTKSPHAKILAAWMLERCDPGNEKRMGQTLDNGNPHICEHAIRIAEPYLGAKHALFEKTLMVHGNQNPRVACQVALSTGGLELRLVDELTLSHVLSRIALQHSEDRWTRLAVQSAAPKRAGAVFRAYLRAVQSQSSVATNGQASMTREMTALIASFETPANDADTFAILLKQKDSIKWPGIVGLAEGLERRRKSLTTIAQEMPKAAMADYVANVVAIFKDAEKRTHDEKKPLDDRVMSVRVLGQAPWGIARKGLQSLAMENASVEIRVAALRAIASHQDKEVPALLMKLWPGAGPSLRREILESMLRQPARVNVLLDEIESKRLKSSELDPARTRQLVNHKNPDIRSRAAKLLKGNLPADRAKVLAEYQPALALKGDAKNGRAIFQKNCATCHRVAGIGTDVGPDIADTRTKTLAAMLNDIIAPNAAIDNNYVNYVVSTKDGRILTGLLATETASSITLKRAEGQTDAVLRKDIDEIASTGISLMPEGLEKEISVQGMADLLSFLKNWRYLDGSVPVGN